MNPDTHLPLRSHAAFRCPYCHKPHGPLTTNNVSEKACKECRGKPSLT